MAINLRSVSKELHSLLKVRAAEEKVSIESLCVRFLWWGLDVKGSSGGVAQRERNSEGRTRKADVKLTVAGSIPAPTTKTDNFPRKVGEICPHGHSNWMQCDVCNPRLNRP